jgi:glycosyltransferase involved in cell wall biosynthesis
MRVSFVLPKLYDFPIGGFKVPFQFANELTLRGHQVTVVLPITLENRASLKDWVKFAVAKVKVARGSAVSWFPFDTRVRQVVIPVLSSGRLPSADATVLIGWKSVKNTSRSAPQAGVFFHIVQDYEFWMSSDEMRREIETALQRPDVELVATSSVVANMIKSAGGVPMATINPGLEAGEFALDAPIEFREKSILFAYRLNPVKDMQTALKAISLIQAAEPDVVVECFGAANPEWLPKGVKHHGEVSNVELRALYNRASVYFLTSRYEGWGIPAAEAMACGAAVVSTRCGGVEDFLEDDVNGSLVAVGDAPAVAESILRLLRDSSTRVRLAKCGVEVASRMTVRNSTDQLERLLKASVLPA